MDDKRRGVDASNRDFLRYDQVEKEQSYRLSEAENAELFDDEFRIRSCDAGRLRDADPRERSAFAHELGTALEEIGFAILENTGIDPAVYEDATAATIELFTKTTLEERLRFRGRQHGSVNQGYFPMQETTEIHPDLVEGWVFCRRAFDLDPARPVATADFWPMPRLEPVFRRLWLAHEPLVLPLMQSVLTHLGARPDLYDRRLRGANFGLRLNYYPPVTADDDKTGAGRLLGHEDVDLFTMLPAPEVEGLQVLNRKNGRWVRLQAPRGAIVLNTGDYMQRITNDRLPSTTHRVSKPRDPALLGRTRVSFPMNVYLDESEILEVLPGLGPAKYEPVDALTFHTSITRKYYGDDYGK